jgi:hypothetical protein
MQKRQRDRAFRPGLAAVVAAVAFALLAASLAPAALAHPPTRDDYTSLVRLGWGYELRGSFRRRAAAGIGPVTEAARALSRSGLCVIGEQPHALAAATVESFAELLEIVFGPPEGAEAVTLAEGPDGCGAVRRYLRLHSRPGAGDAMRRDLITLDAMHGLDLPRGWQARLVSPGQAVTLFGPAGPVSHVLVRQPPPGAAASRTELALLRSILLEELFQSVSFGLDVPRFDPRVPALSKIEERPVRIGRRGWETPEVMAELLRATPRALCGFDVFILHALAEAGDGAQTPADLPSVVESRFDSLLAAAARTLALPAVAVLLDPACTALPP